MNLGAFFCLILAHFIADFPLQFKSIIKLRNDEDKKTSFLGNVYHSCIHAVLSIISIIYFLSWPMVLVVLLIALSHVLIDYIKSRTIIKHPFMKFSLCLFLADQMAHFLCIFLSFYLVCKDPSVWSVLKNLRDELHLFMNTSLTSFTYNHKLILALVFLVIGLWGVGIFIRLVLRKLSLLPYKGAINLKLELVKELKNDGATDGGFIIGILERLFIIISIIVNMPIVIGFILTVKSVARLKKFDDERFVEIFIMGSFMSFISAIVIGYIIKQLI